MRQLGKKQLISALRGLGRDHEPPAGWEDRVLEAFDAARLRRERRRRLLRAVAHWVLAMLFVVGVITGGLLLGAGLVMLAEAYL